MSVIIRLQNLPWSANALDIRNFFRGLSIPEGGVHIVGGELGDAFIAFSTDEDARQAMMLDGGKIKEIQVKLLLSSRSEMHKVIEAARQNVPLMSMAPTPAPASAPAPAPIPTPAPSAPTPLIPTITPFSSVLGSPAGFSSFGIPGLGNPNEIPQPAVIEPPAPLISPSDNTAGLIEEEDEKLDKRGRDRERRRSRSRSRDRERKERKRDRRDRSRSRERRRRDRSRSRDRRDRKRDRKERSRSTDRSPSRRSRDRRERRSPRSSQEKVDEAISTDVPYAPTAPAIGSQPLTQPPLLAPMKQLLPNPIMMNGMNEPPQIQNRFVDPSMTDTFNKLQELGKKRNPNAFQGLGEQQNGGRFQAGRGGGNSFRREGRPSRFDNEQLHDCCVAIKNAPNHTSYGDVRRFFPFVIDKHGIKMINDNMGRRTGTIFVRFVDTRSKQLALQRKYGELKGGEVVVEPLEDAAYEAAVDSFLPYREDNDEEEKTLVIADEDTKQQAFSVLKLTDLPNYVKEHDIIKMFSEFSLLSIVLNNCRTTRSKVAFVQFVNPEDAKVAFDKKDSYMFGRRKPTITAMTNEEYEKEKIMDDKNGEGKETVNAIEVPVAEAGAPRDPRQRRADGPPATAPAPAPATTTTPKAPPVPFFPGPFGGPFPGPMGVPINPMMGNAMNNPMGGAINNPMSSAMNSPLGGTMNNAIGNQMNNPMGNSMGNQMKNSIGNQMTNLGGSAAPPWPEEEPLECVLLKGLPDTASNRIIVTFLSDTGAMPSRIHLMLDAEDQPTGDCFCEFRSSQEARLAATKHGHTLDGCRVTVDLVSRTVMEAALGRPKAGESRGLLGSMPQPTPAPQPFFDAPPQRGGFAPRPYRGRGGFDVGRGGFDGGRGGYDIGRGGFDGGRGGFDGGRGGFDGGRGGFDSGRGFDRYPRGGFDRGGYRGGRGFDRGGRGFERGRGRGYRGRGAGGGVGGFENGRSPRPDEPEDPALEDFGAPGCVVSMENVPFRATIDDILTFFSEFELTQDDVIRRYNERGQPTGDARVAFRAPFDAQRAVKTRHMDTIHDRRINLMIL